MKAVTISWGAQKSYGNPRKAVTAAVPIILAFIADAKIRGKWPLEWRRYGDRRGESADDAAAPSDQYAHSGDRHRRPAFGHIQMRARSRARGLSQRPRS